MLFLIRYYIWTDIIYLVRTDVPTWSLTTVIKIVGTCRRVNQKDEIRGYIKACSKLVCSLKQLMIELCTTYEPSCVSYDTVRRWKNKI